MLQQGEASTTIIEHKDEEIRVTFGHRPGAKFGYEAIMFWFSNSQACECKEECMMCDPFKKYRKRRVEMQNPLNIEGEERRVCRISNKESWFRGKMMFIFLLVLTTCTFLRCLIWKESVGRTAEMKCSLSIDEKEVRVCKISRKELWFRRKMMSMSLLESVTFIFLRGFLWMDSLCGVQPARMVADVTVHCFFIDGRVPIFTPDQQACNTFDKLVLWPLVYRIHHTCSTKKPGEWPMPNCPCSIQRKLKKDAESRKVLKGKVRETILFGTSRQEEPHNKSSIKLLRWLRKSAARTELKTYEGDD